MMTSIPPIAASGGPESAQRATPVLAPRAPELAQLLPLDAPDPASLRAFVGAPSGSEAGSMLKAVDQLQAQLAQQMGELARGVQGVPPATQALLNGVMKSSLLSLQVTLLTNSAQQASSGMQTLFRQQN